MPCSNFIMKTQYDPGAGTHINRACKEACEIANETGEEISFNFNDIILTATPEADSEELANEYSRKSEQRRKAYQESEEGKRAAEKRAAEIVEKNDKVNALVAALPEILKNGNMGNLMDWLEFFTLPADDIAVKINHGQIADLLESAGYVENDGVGNPPDWFSNQDRMGRYIVGQAISCLRMNMPPHGVTLGFVKKWRGLNCSNVQLTASLPEDQP
jgi:hypothetical protein